MSSADGPGRRLLFLAVCGLGVSALITQLVLMREMLGVFAGNEMVLGVILGNWLLLMGLGSYLGKTAARFRRPVNALVVAQILVALLPVASLFALRSLRNVVFTRGAEIGVTETVTASLVLLAPYCLIAGYVLTLACKLLASGDDSASIGQVYFLDVLGDIAGGLLFSFVLIYFVDHFWSLYVPAAVNLALAVLVAVRARRPLLAALAGGLLAGAAVLAVGWDLDAISTDLQYPRQSVVFHDHSPFGRLVVTESAGQQTFYENGVPLFSTDAGETAEETVHYALAQRPQARRVLLVSGGISGTAREILKYPTVEHLDYVELDPLILEAGRAHLPDDPRLHVQNTDGRLWVKRARRAGLAYDVVIVDVPDPSTSQINRFYTEEFFREVKAVLTSGGVLSFSLAEFEQYVTDELAELIAVAQHTAKEVFAIVLMLPDGRVYFVASDGPLTDDVAGGVEAAGVHTWWVRREYLATKLTPQRRIALEQAANREAPLNRDFTPALYYRQLRWWISRYELRFGPVEAALVLFLVGSLVFLRPVSFAILTTGFAASAVEVVLLLGFQILYGCVYQWVGVIVTLFMLGLALGSYIMNRRLARWSRRGLVRLEAAIAVYAAGVPLVLLGLGRIENAWLSGLASQTAVPLLALGIAVLVGMEFPLAAKAEFRGVTGTAARLYLADYLGAALGALVVSTLLVPLVGVFGVCLLAAGLNVTSGLIIRATSPAGA